jgi:predicted RecA/RadA family phage recombinase
MKNLVQKGEILELVAPVGGVSSGVPLVIGSLVVFPVTDADQGAKFSAMVEGVFTVVKVGAQAWSAGDIVYFDAANSRFTTASATGVRKVGAVTVAALAAATSGVIRLDGVSTVAVA